MKPGDLIVVHDEVEGRRYHVVKQVEGRKVFYNDPSPDGYIGAKIDICEVVTTLELIYAGPDRENQGKLAQGLQLLDNTWVVIIDGKALRFFDDCWLKYTREV